VTTRRRASGGALARLAQGLVVRSFRRWAAGWRAWLSWSVAGFLRGERSALLPGDRSSRKEGRWLARQSRSAELLPVGRPVESVALAVGGRWLAACVEVIGATAPYSFLEDGWPSAWTERPAPRAGPLVYLSRISHRGRCQAKRSPRLPSPVLPGLPVPSGTPSQRGRQVPGAAGAGRPFPCFSIQQPSTAQLFDAKPSGGWTAPPPSLGPLIAASNSSQLHPNPFELIPSPSGLWPDRVGMTWNGVGMASQVYPSFPSSRSPASTYCVSRNSVHVSRLLPSLHLGWSVSLNFIPLSRLVRRFIRGLQASSDPSHSSATSFVRRALAPEVLPRIAQRFLLVFSDATGTAAEDC
jgi:hypothetical protein